jgi:tetratricopeptide (TPR) repeat protein
MKLGVYFCLLGLMLCTSGCYALDKNTSFALSHYILAVMYEDLGDVETAISEYQQVLKADYKNAIVHLDLALNYIKKNEIPT